jgi:hypothetical protein
VYISLYISPPFDPRGSVVKTHEIMSSLTYLPHITILPSPVETLYISLNTSCPGNVNSKIRVFKGHPPGVFQFFASCVNLIRTFCLWRVFHIFEQAFELLGINHLLLKQLHPPLSIIVCHISTPSSLFQSLQIDPVVIRFQPITPHIPHNAA